MKANEAPEKIILSADIDTRIIHDEWVINDYTDNIKIEYTRTDAFIEKAVQWLEEQKEMTGISFQEDFIERFKTYMKGE